jgi:hypothetical protein
VVGVRINLLHFPLERDEGEFAYVGQLILKGIPPYTEAANMKLPGTYYVYAAMMCLFGESTQGIHLGLVLINLVSSFFLFLIIKNKFNTIAAIYGTCSFLLLTLNCYTLSFAAHATNFVILFALMAIYTFLNSNYNNRLLFLSGILSGLTFMMKQPGILLCLPLIVLLNIELIRERKQIFISVLNKNITFIFGILTPFILFALYIKSLNAFDTFWFWTFQYALQYANQVPLSSAFEIFKKQYIDIVGGYFLFWIASFMGLIWIIKTQTVKLPVKYFVTSFFVLSFMAVCVSFQFRPHYFILWLPIVCILCGLFFSYIHNKLSESVREIALPLCLILFFVPVIFLQRGYLFNEDVNILSHEIYSLAPFPESVQIADYIKNNTSEYDYIYVFGSEPQIYFLSERKAATSQMYLYPLTEIHFYSRIMQEQAINQIEYNKPKYILLTIPVSWEVKNNSERLIFNWLSKYIDLNYEIDGIIDIICTNFMPKRFNSIYKWGDDAKKYKPISHHKMVLYKRINCQ